MITIDLCVKMIAEIDIEIIHRQEKIELMESYGVPAALERVKVAVLIERKNNYVMFLKTMRQSEG